jgi:tryptophan 2,3-dioxygenase
MTSETQPFTYGVYLRIPELLDLQTPLGPDVPDEMLFILGQQAQELWFKQCLHDLRRVLDLFSKGEITTATRLLDRITRILDVLGSETEVLESIEPAQFHRFRGVLRAASGFESEQFRELEIASGLRDEIYLKMVSRFVDVDATVRRWPVSLHDAFISAVSPAGEDAPAAISAIYRKPEERPVLYALAESCSAYDMRFQAWRFHHIQVVERVIGPLSPGTGGSPGSGYLNRTLSYRFFPELWQVRNDMTANGREAERG